MLLAGALPFPGERLAQHRAGAVEAGLDHVLAEAKGLRRLGGGEPLDLAQHEYRTIRFRQRVDHRLQVPAELAGERRLLGIGARGGDAVARAVAHDRLGDRRFRASPVAGERLMNGDATLELKLSAEQKKDLVEYLKSI